MVEILRLRSLAPSVTNAKELSLDQVQRWLQGVITHPLGVIAGLDSDEVRTVVDLPPESVEQIITRSRALDSTARLEIYANAYYARLFEVLAAEYPALTYALGTDLFHQFALGYLQRHPSTSYTLVHLGSRFPEDLAATRPARDFGASPPDWADFLIDLARLERTYSEVFDGPGVEGQSLLSTADLAAVRPEAWADARLSLVPCLRLLELQFPVHTYATAVRSGEAPAPPSPESTKLVITRREYVVRRAAVSPPEFAALQTFASGGTIGDAISAAADVFAGNETAFAESLQGWFQQWTQAGYFAAIVMA